MHGKIERWFVQHADSSKASRRSIGRRAKWQTHPMSQCKEPATRQIGKGAGSSKARSTRRDTGWDILRKDRSRQIVVRQTNGEPHTSVMLMVRRENKLNFPNRKCRTTHCCTSEFSVKAAGNEPSVRRTTFRFLSRKKNARRTPWRMPRQVVMAQPQQGQ
ncbi:hypothetical protein CONLIGDRAFT_424738 [Coniochaeta ligniaria NRRL 30616]|uniref:Uncharacterized protein n=1 Tax=Coniochaeta ligniaria NRRL 30616 TaxID=1408157 RepID=A0A1J7JI76_9PEZI|nr:hypothetical protein CONLIGDRAFT_424738 [Coniochaeta ligniaria NRRL 30616]